MELSACKASLLIAVVLAALLLPRGLGAVRPCHSCDGGEARRLGGEAALVKLRDQGVARPLWGSAAAGATVPSNAGGSVSRRRVEEGARRPVARRMLLRGINADVSKPSCRSNYEQIM
ncbi:hypothetical protein E2562_001466 [Oryza meyeriana var. granulata]|uniref:Uncharacterized protein n=1 Tax=Oryza meyeriana var. granulata TaxID=110450 RepID=A0A6G1DCW9_9ORYZ|nr:hypothetical protein E2562_001466 [Oryza meyeriana var. granulata]